MMLLRRPPWLPLSLAVLCLGFACVGACGDQVVQTAMRGPALAAGGMGGVVPEMPFELTCPSPPNDFGLPSGNEFGEGDVVESVPWASGNYEAFAGPGIYVAARDTARLYVNGTLLRELTAAETPTFVPLSLLPGENTIALSLDAHAGPPVALVQVDELSGSYLSDETWKWTTTPSGAWKSSGYDDSAWLAAHRYGRYGEVPGCDPASGFPTTSEASWIGAEPEVLGPIVLRTVIRIAPEGFAEGTTGGETAAPVVVSTFAEFESVLDSKEPATIFLAEGTYDFRRTGAEITDVELCPSVCSDNPTKTTYRVLVGTQTCADPLVTKPRDERILRVGSNKTIVGLGRGAAIRGTSLDFQASKNVILRNVVLYDINRDYLEAGDALGMTQPASLWVDHVTLKWVSDALADVLPGSKGISFSHIHFDGENSADCDGQDGFASTATDSDISIYDSRFDHISTRSPLISGPNAHAHLWNNLFSNTFGWTVGAACGAQVVLEGNTFESVEAATRLSSCDASGLGRIDAKEGTNLYRDASNVHLGGDGTEPHQEVFTPSYPYTLELANTSWPLVVSRAGAGGPWALPLVLD